MNSSLAAYRLAFAHFDTSLHVTNAKLYVMYIGILVG